MQRKADWKFRVLVTSDRHIDSPDSDWELQKEHLNQAREIDAPVLDAGDLFDIINSKNDKRRSKSGVRERYNTSTYVDEVVDQTADDLKPWADLFAVFLSGNHEQSLVDHAETSLMNRMLERIRFMTGVNIHHGGYGASIAFAFVDETKRVRTECMWMEHGAGGGGPVTGDLIAMYRKATYLPDFSIIASGHTHDQAYRMLQRLRRSPNGKLYEDTVHLVKLASYKKEFQKGFHGWHARRGAAPKPVGAWWIEFGWCRREEKVTIKLIAA
jgi:UDP-2,3-diacylglucosamine pyrophosphatase LpxH